MSDRTLPAALAAPPRAATALAVGFSGGLDSTALLHAALRHCPGNRPLRAVHVCHHLHADAPVWARHCADRCAQWGLACTRLDVRVRDAGQGVEAAARAARYAALAAELRPGEWLVTAHHAQDQAETFLLQALRGAGVAGLAAMPRCAAFGGAGHWRPWLGVERAAIADYANANALDWIEDPGNRDTSFDRNYLRSRVWPVLAQRWPAAARTLARSAGHAAQAARVVEADTGERLAAIENGDASLDVAGLVRLSGEQQATLLRAWLARARLDAPSHRHVEQIRAITASRLTASPCVRFGDTEVRLFDGRLFAMTALAQAPDVTLRWPPKAELALPAGCGRLAFAAAADSAARPVLTVGFRRGGERLAMRGGHRRLKEFLRERRVPPWVRERLPLVYHGDELIAVADLWGHPRLVAIQGKCAGALRWTHRLPGWPHGRSP